MQTLISRHPLVSYFVLAFGLSWLAWLPYILSETGLGVLPWRVPEVLGSSQTLGLMPGAYLGPITAALVVTAVAEGRPGLRRWARRLLRWRLRARWYVLAVLAVPVAGVAATFALPGAAEAFRRPSVTVLLAYLPMLVMQVLTTGVSEEPGWRDFAQPRLQDRFGPLAGSLVLGPLWGAWHLPLFFSEWAGWPDVDWTMPAEFMLSSVLLSIVLSWVFNASGGSLLMAMLVHSGVNALYSQLWPEMFPSLDAFRDSLHAVVVGSGVAAAVLIVVTRGRLGLPPSLPLPASGGSPPGHHRPTGLRDRAAPTSPAGRPVGRETPAPGPGRR